MFTLLSNNQWKLFLQSSIDELQKIPLFIDEIPPLRRLKEDKLYFLKLSLHELATNAIIHGNNLDILKKVEITLTIEREKIFIAILDEGKGFTEDMYKHSISSALSLNEGGRGLQLVRETMELVSMNAINEKFTMSFVLNA